MKKSMTLLTPAEAGRRVGRTPAAIRAAADSGALPVAVRTPSGNRLFEPDEVDECFRFRGRRERGTQGETA